MNEEATTAQAERDWLLDELSSLIGTRGEATFLDAPIIEPTETFFPDPWTPDEAGVASLAHRVFAQAGLDGVSVEVPDRRETALAPWTFAYGLAVQTAVRLLGFWARRHLMAQMNLILDDHFRSAWKLVANDVDGLVKRLGLSTSVSSGK